MRIYVGGTPTGGVYINGVQLEAASTPSSYIPTAGATATRAAETLTIPAANMDYPTPEVIGPEEVTNGTFDTDTAWTKPAGVTITGGEAVFNEVGNGQNFVQSVGSYPPVVDGTPYLLTFEIKSISAGSLQAMVGARTGAVFNTVGVHQAVVVAASSLSFTGLKCVGVTTATIDNISVQEINPLAVSFAMDGFMTYADEGSLSNVKFLDWTVSTKYIRQYLRTDSTKTGMLYLLQNDGVNLDVINGAGLEYSPGINVPFSIASRHGSTFINGAVDGTALTADLTPVALPDLSATDLSLAPTFNGYISKFLMWGDTTGDIGDTGIAEAST
jgi:hypothetical protein